MTSADPIAVALPDDAMRLLTWGLHQWGGPAYCTDAMALGMGFADAEHMLVEVDSLRDALSATSALTPADWTRALLAVEVVFASDVVGAASEWEIVTGWTDEYTVGVLRRLQSQLRAVRGELPSPP